MFIIALMREITKSTISCSLICNIAYNDQIHYTMILTLLKSLMVDKFVSSHGKHCQ